MHYCPKTRIYYYLTIEPYFKTSECYFLMSERKVHKRSFNPLFSKHHIM